MFFRQAVDVPIRQGIASAGSFFASARESALQAMKNSIQGVSTPAEQFIATLICWEALYKTTVTPYGLDLAQVAEGSLFFDAMCPEQPAEIYYLHDIKGSKIPAEPVMLNIRQVDGSTVTFTFPAFDISTNPDHVILPNQMLAEHEAVHFHNHGSPTLAVFWDETAEVHRRVEITFVDYVTRSSSVYSVSDILGIDELYLYVVPGMNEAIPARSGKFAMGIEPSPYIKGLATFNADYGATIPQTPDSPQTGTFVAGTTNVSMKLVNIEGDPVSGAEVLWSDDQFNSGSVSTGLDGMATIAHSGMSNLSLSINGSISAGVFEGGFIGTFVDDTAYTDVRRVRVQVVDANGNPITGMKVLCLHPSLFSKPYEFEKPDYLIFMRSKSIQKDDLPRLELNEGNFKLTDQTGWVSFYIQHEEAAIVVFNGAYSLGIKVENLDLMEHEFKFKIGEGYFEEQVGSELQFETVEAPEPPPPGP